MPTAFATSATLRPSSITSTASTQRPPTTFLPVSAQSTSALMAATIILSPDPSIQASRSPFLAAQATTSSAAPVATIISTAVAATTTSTTTLGPRRTPAQGPTTST